ncbi:hypothetical protein ACEWK1_11225 [Metabacillus sp. YM-086]|uniref:hypothetical protein n=1 Tax=Metabacillus sp. YM-086 TaxID=3341729 RepID=UPI003A8732BE
MSSLTWNDYQRHKSLFSNILGKILESGPEWFQGEAQKHLNERIARGHLKEHATIEQYNHFILFLLNQPKHTLTLHYDGMKYIVGNGKWIVIINESGIVETCFPPDNYVKYLSPSRGYVDLGKLREVLPDVEEIEK